jgi:phosphoinositide-3-kinase regulatory subunit 4
MGQGYSLTTLSAASASIDVPELADLVHDKTLSSARFMKSIRARHQQGFVFIKAVMKPYPSFQVKKYVKQITKERDALVDVPNTLGYQRIVEIGAGGFLVRQHIYSSVYDRMSTRPFLEDIEKKWLVFQLLCAVRDCHARDVFHGDIKTENLLVTSWNWLYLTDFSSSFKPTQLPEDNPADFSFYFDTSGRRTCYLAPERFTADGSTGGGSTVDWAMDIFSIGCVVAELFLESPIFSLSQIFKYRTGEYSPEHTHLVGIGDHEVRDMILNMIDLDPEKRYSADEYLTFYKTKIFPDYFYDFLHQYMLDLTDPSSGQKPVILESANFGESDDKIDRIHFDFDKISYFLGYNRNNSANLAADSVSGKPSLRRRRTSSTTSHFKSKSEPQSDDGTLLFLAVVVSSLRNTARASARLKACELLVLFAERLPDEARLDRILPYIIGLLNDRSDIVKAAALRSMTQLLSKVQVVSPINAYVFPEYIFPRLKQFVLSPLTSPSVLIRAAYASCLASLARSSAQILDSVQAIKADGRLPSLSDNEWAQESTYHGLFDVARVDLVLHFEEATKSLITDPDPSVRRAFLGSVSTLCVFFGSSKASDVILSHLNTYLNDKDWILRCSFFEALVGVAAYVGSANLQRFILPLMIQSLTDPEGFVVERVLRSLARMAAIGLLERATTWEVLCIAVRFLVHPSPWIREAAVQFVVLSTRYVSSVDRYCIILPMVQPFLRNPILDISEPQILDSLKKPLPKAVIDMAFTWATKAEKGVFWNTAIHDAVFVLPEIDAFTSPTSYEGRFATRIAASQRNEEDEQWLNKLRGLGMTPEDEMKLLALREFIWRVAHRRSNDIDEDETNLLNNIMPLNQINVTPQNIFFDTREPIREVKDRPRSQVQPQRNIKEPHTIAEALLDASTTFEDRSTNGIQSDRRIPGPTRTGKSLPKDIPSTQNLAAREVSPTANSPAAKSDGTASPLHRSDSRSTERKAVSPMNFNSTSYRSSPVDRERAMIRKGSELTLSHRNSAMSLMKRTDATKADAAVATSSETAFGKLDGPLQARRITEPSPLSKAFRASGKSRSRSPLSQVSQPDYEPNHSYTGTDQNILRLLGNHFAENYPTDMFDFGEIRHPLSSKAPIRRVTEAGSGNENATSDQLSNHVEPWRPTGHLLALFSEHTAAVNKVVASPDHVFFVTASDDGTCKIWDTTRLEKNVTPRSRHTHRHPLGTKVKALCFIENTHTFVSAADDGSVHAVKVEYKRIDGGESARYGKPSLVRDYQLPSTTPGPDSKLGAGGQASDQEHAVWLHHYRTSSSQSVLLVLTNRSRLIALDLKTMESIYSLQNPLHHGTPITFCLDKRHHWLITGSSHGILDMWDLRFKVRIRSWGLKSCSRIDRILVHPTKGRGRWIIVSCSGEISVWDIEKVTCREIYRPSSAIPASKVGNSAKSYEPWYPDDEPPEKILSRFASQISEPDGSLGLLIDPQPRPDPFTDTSSSNARNESVQPINALYLGTDSLHNASNPSEPIKAPFLLTGGADRTLRFWDVTRPEASTIISAPNSNFDDSAGITPPKSRYEVSHPTSGGSGQLILVEEHTAGVSGASGISAAGSTGSGGGSTPSTPSSKKSGRGGSGGGGDGGANKPPRNTVISAAQQALLRSHLDGIMDVCVLERPYGVMVSVDRGGGVYVFQ